MATVRTILSQCRPLKAAYHGTRAAAFRLLLAISPVLLARVRYRLAWGRWPDFADPTTFDEKLLWLNLYWRHPLKTLCGDKYTMREYVQQQGLGELLPRLYGVYDSVDVIDFDALPKPCVLKCSHGCKCNVFCRLGETLDVAAARRDLRRWMRTDYSRLLGELHYAGMTPRILCEEFLDDGSGGLPTDYKLYCFNGRVACTLACTERVPNGKAQFSFFDRAWCYLAYYKTGDTRVRHVSRPDSYIGMLTVAERLSQPFPFVRMDFYSIRGRLVLGEMTFTPDACIDNTYTDEAQQIFGRLLTLPAKYPP